MNPVAQLKKALPAVAGGIAGNFANNFAGKFLGNDKLRAGAVLALGLVLMSSKKTETLGLGVAVTGGTKLVASFMPSLAGYDDYNLGSIVTGVGDIVTGVAGTEDGFGVEF